ncbi:exosortase V [Novosphingobium piscinae]|uniref:Exosortase V n=1 Tax=Novosphingobium piscinae TaxID=1507448 RepID=A0A7X1FW92_9SPHN|nr:exosortase V [Novosphingobium piscinae]MBC2668136.1 exosortase V [Novosphingobium piscinae]
MTRADDVPAAALPERMGNEALALRGSLPAALVFAAGALVLAAPTLAFVARESWSTEQGAHGPIVLATGLWLLLRLLPQALTVAVQPPAWRVMALFALVLPAYLLSRIAQVVELEGYFMYAALLVGIYGLVGTAAMRRLWFPLFYLVFMFPPPETVVYTLTLPMKMGVSTAAIAILHAFGYPIAGQGVMIYVGQYELLVAAACSGLNSIISLSAISLFYIYIRHEAEWRYAAFLVLLIVPVSLIANLIRVLILILLTYHAGDAAAQGFLHNFAGLLMFAVALLTIFALDALCKPIWNWVFAKRLAGKPVSTGVFS